MGSDVLLKRFVDIGSFDCTGDGDTKYFWCCWKGDYIGSAGSKACLDLLLPRFAKHSCAYDGDWLSVHNKGHKGRGEHFAWSAINKPDVRRGFEASKLIPSLMVVGELHMLDVNLGEGIHESQAVSYHRSKQFFREVISFIRADQILDILQNRKRL